MSDLAVSTGATIRQSLPAQFNKNQSSINDLSNHQASARRARRMAWQVAAGFPCLVLVATFSLMSEAPIAAWSTVSGILLMCLVVTVSVTDLRWHKIPNWATYTAILWAWLINAFAQVAPESTVNILGAVGLADSLAGAVIPFFFMLVIFSLTGGGAGDVKLTAALGAFLGLDQVIDAILLSFVFAGGFALLRAVWLLGPKNLLEILLRTVGHRLAPWWVLPPNQAQQRSLRQPMPLGPAFALGTLLVLFAFDLDQFLSSVLAGCGVR